MVALYFLIVVFGLLVGLLITPIVLCIDTYTNRYYLLVKGIGKVSLLITDEDLILHLRLFIFKFNIKILEWLAKPPKKIAKKQPPKTAKKRRRVSRSKLFSWSKGLAILNSFTVLKFKLELDSGDYCRNARWFPIVYLLFPQQQVQLNFNGQNHCQLLIQNRIIKVLYALFFK